MSDGAPLSIDPARMGGAVCIAGTRIDTRTIAGMVWQHGIASVHECWDYLTDEQIRAACWWEWQMERASSTRGRWARRRLNPDPLPTLTRPPSSPVTQPTKERQP